MSMIGVKNINDYSELENVASENLMNLLDGEEFTVPMLFGIVNWAKISRGYKVRLVRYVRDNFKKVCHETSRKDKNYIVYRRVNTDSPND
jgi:hypothetical protein